MNEAGHKRSYVSEVLDDYWTFLGDYLTESQIEGLSIPDLEKRRKYVFDAMSAPQVISIAGGRSHSSLVLRMAELVRDSNKFCHSQDQ